MPAKQTLHEESMPNAVISFLEGKSRIDCTTTPGVQGVSGMSARGKQRQGTRTAEITVVVVRPTTPNSDVLDNVYQILAASKIA